MSIKYTENSDLIIHHAYRVSENELVSICVNKSHGSPTLYWSDGIIFYFEQIPPIMNSKVEDDFINGKDHWGEVYYADLENYSENLEMSDGEFRGAKIRLINASNFVPHKDFAKWAKQHK
ncbi:MAG: hypothetical protein KGH64_03145 [Candidatus Micrarchaeota archaeon]|nr:hypothetical protein [Candidatus Micrarchaeota archaeon]MDE1834309.1 hypothetical protein [Candidatus Micrarchaeota archaeon]MDE1859403.1 hypothetical protein [Candidatus Micrarchaeota archaeon]